MSFGRRVGCSAFVFAVLLAGCGAATFPRANSLTDGAFANGTIGPGTIQVLPVDFQTWTYKGNENALPAAVQSLENQTLGNLLPKLWNKGYQVVVRDWNGGCEESRDALPLCLPMSSGGVMELVYWFSGYGSAKPKRDELPSPRLPPMNQFSNADATLYIGGWAYLGTSKTPTWKKVLKVALITVAVVGVVVVVAVLARGKGGGLGNFGGKVAQGAAKGAQGIAKGTASAARVAGSALKVVARSGIDVARVLARSRLQLNINGSGNGNSLSMCGDPSCESEIVIDLPPPQPVAIHAPGAPPQPNFIATPRIDFFAQKKLPHSGSSRMHVEATLVDNHSGRVLWHSQQIFKANATSAKDVKKAMEKIFSSLPQRAH